MGERQEKANYQKQISFIIIGLLLIALVQIISMALLSNAVKSQKTIAEIINTSGSQRANIRQIALLANRYAMGYHHEKKRLEALKNIYINNHNTLSSRKIISIMPDKIRHQLDSLYHQQKWGIDPLMIKYISDTNALLNLSDRDKNKLKLGNIIYKESQGPLFSQTNKAVKLVEQALIENRLYADKIHLYSFLIICLVIIIEYLFIFLPVMKRAKKSYEKVAEIALKDNLTELGNRQFLIRQAGKAIERAKRFDCFMAIFYIDLDNFKDVNDAYGTVVGDLLLNEVSQRLNQVSRGSDTLVRLGGDEFALLLEDVESASSISDIAQRYLNSLTHPIYMEDKKFQISLSLGIAVFPHAADNINDLMTRADIALYKAKNQGKNKYAFYTDALHLESQRRSQIDVALLNAIENNEFKLFYQPQINARTGEIIGVEALLRWNNQALGNPTPDEFIPVAESGNHIIAMGRWILNQALKDLNHIKKICQLKKFKMSINLSAKELFNETFLEDKFDAVDKFPNLISDLVFELTETSLVNDFKQAKAVLDEIDKKGISIALDDFGTGYSSLKYLKKLPIKIIKIDKSFVQDINIDQNDMEIIKAITKLAIALGFKLVAEGVESKEQLKFMLNHQCHIIQGYYFSKPLAIDDLITFIKNKKNSEKISD